MKERPDYVQNFEKPAGTEIKHIGGNWYLYERSYVYDPTIRRSRKVSGSCLGKITADGLVPSRKRMVKTDEPLLSNTVEAGSVLFYWKRTAALRARLRKHFPDLWQPIYCIALLRLVRDVRFKRLQLHLEDSLLGQLFPEVRLSSGFLASLLKDLGSRRDRIAGFMREDLDGAEAFMLCDGSRITAVPNTMEPAGLEDCYLMRSQQQTNLLCVSVLTAASCIPVYYKQYAAGTPKVEAFRDVLKEVRLTEARCAVVCDEGAAGAEALDELDESGLGCIMALERGGRSAEFPEKIPDGPAQYSGMFTIDNRAVFFKPFENENHVVWLYYDAQLYADEAADACGRLEARNEARSRRREQLAGRGVKLMDADLEALRPETFEDLRTKHPDMGTFAIRTNRKELSGEEVLRICRRRQTVERFCRTFGGATASEGFLLRSRASREAWLFLNHVSAQLGLTIQAEIESAGEKKAVALEDLHQALGTVTASNILGEWRIAPVKASVRTLIGLLEKEVSEAGLQAVFSTAASELAHQTGK